MKTKEKLKRERFGWVCITIMVCLLMICVTLIVINNNPFTIKLEANKEFADGLQGLEIVQIDGEDILITIKESDVDVGVIDNYLVKSIDEYLKDNPRKEYK